MKPLDYLTPLEASLIMGITLPALYKRINRGKVPIVREGHLLYIDSSLIPSLSSAGRLIDGRKSHPLYATYMNMMRRCYNPETRNFYRYGGRGIRVCKRWREDFWSFCLDMGEKPSSQHSLDRYPDNDGNYKKSNCRWATAKEQQANKE